MTYSVGNEFTNDPSFIERDVVHHDNCERERKDHWRRYFVRQWQNNNTNKETTCPNTVADVAATCRLPSETIAQFGFNVPVFVYKGDICQSQ